MTFEISRKNPILKAFRTDLVKALAHEQVRGTQAMKCDEAMIEENNSITSIKVTECGGFLGGFSDSDDRPGAFVVAASGTSDIEITYNCAQFQLLAPIAAQSKDKILLDNVRASPVSPILSDLGAGKSNYMMYVNLAFYDRNHEQFSEEVAWNPSIRTFQINFGISDPAGMLHYMMASVICRNDIVREMGYHGFDPGLCGPINLKDRLQRLTLKDLVCMARSVNAIRAREERDAPIEIPSALIHAARYESVHMTRTEKCRGIPKIKFKSQPVTP